MRNVFVLDTNKQPLDPVHPGWARTLLSTGQAAVWRRFPFTIILTRAVTEPATQPLRLKTDPGSKVTGLAIVNDVSGEVVFAAELVHRGQRINQTLDTRRAIRRSRRRRKTRYRQPRFSNRRRREDWLPPSLESRLTNVLTWTRRLMRWCPIAAISQELVKFDVQQMENPEIRGVEYQQGQLSGYELREYLLEKWGRQCAYCDARDVPLQVEHIVCRARGGTHRISNLTLACEPCNLKKSTQDIRDFLKNRPERVPHILAQAKASLKDAAPSLWCAGGVRFWGRTKFNRMQRGLPKTHWVDAACVGTSTPESLRIKQMVPLQITATGHGCRQMCRMDRFGFPRTGPKQSKRVQGFQSGDIVKAIVGRGKKVGTYVGRVAVRATGSFNIRTATGGTVQGISYRHCTVLHHCDGDSYRDERRVVFPPAA